MARGTPHFDMDSIRLWLRNLEATSAQEGATKHCCEYTHSVIRPEFVNIPLQICSRIYLKTAIHSLCAIYDVKNTRLLASRLEDRLP